MLKERGNLITEGIPLTRDLLEFALENNYKISLRTGDYGKDIPKSRAHYDDNLLTQLYNLYVNGDCYLPRFVGVFNLNTENIRVAFKKRGLGMLSYEERFRLYGKNIFEQSCATQIANHGRLCNFSDPEHHARAKATMVEEYKVDNPSKSPEFQEKKIQTNLRKRGVKWPAQDPNVRAQQIATLMENWKVDNPSKNPELQAKKAVTAGINFEGVGFASPILNPIIRATNLANLGVEIAMQNPEIARKNQRARADNDLRYEALLNLREMKERGEEITDAHVIEVAGLFGKVQEINILKEFGVKEPHLFTTEIKIQNLLDSLDVEYIHNAKKAHSVCNANNEYYELDAYIPKLNLGIEINGRAYHSVNKARYGNPKSKDYHFEKFKAFHESGILMLSFTDYEQDFFTEDYVNIIKHHLLGEPLNVSKEFLEFNQISSIEESLNYGLFDPSRFTGNFEDHQHQRFIEDFEYWDCGIVK